MAGDALVDELEIGLDRVLQPDPAGAQPLDRIEDVGAGQREVLDALALILAQIFLDLAAVVLALVQGDTDRLVGGDHRLAEQPGRLALDVEILLLLEAEQFLVECRPGSHLAALDVVGEVVEQIEPDVVGGGILAPAGNLVPPGIEIARRAMLVDEIEVAPADPFEDEAALAERPGGGVGGLGAVRQRVVVGGLGIGDAERHSARAWPVRGAELGGLAFGLAVEQQVDPPLDEAQHVLGRMLVAGDEPEQAELALERLRVGRGEFAKFEAVEPERVVRVDRQCWTFPCRNTALRSNCAASRPCASPREARSFPTGRCG